MKPLQRLVSNRRLNDQPIRVFLFLVDELDTKHHGALKQAFIAKQLSLHQPPVRRILRRW